MLDNNGDNQSNKSDPKNIDHDETLHKLEEIWDKQLLKGDDYESEDFNLPKDDNRQNGKSSIQDDGEIQQVKERRGRSI